MKIGIIGLGDMGKLYARIFADAGLPVTACDRPENYDLLKSEYADSSIEIVKDGKNVSANADFILYCVEAENIEQVVAQYGPYTKENAIVGGQTSVKAPEISAFEKHLPKSSNIVSIHALHGPNVNPKNQVLIVIKHRCENDLFEEALKILGHTGSKIECLASAEEHDKMMADIQVVTHIGFESIGTSFMHRGVYPWENPLHSSGLDNLKLLITLRIFSYKHHVYSGLAMMNPYAKGDVRTYARAENELFGLMISEEKEAFESLVLTAKEKVFKGYQGNLMLNDELMSEYSLHPLVDHLPNSHLSLLAMVLTWSRLGTNPYKNLVCQTPPFKLRVGMAEYLFMNPELLAESMNAALYDKSIRQDDLAFHTAVQEWAHIVEIGDKIGYEGHFQKTKKFLADRLEEGRKLSGLLIERLNNGKN